MQFLKLLPVLLLFIFSCSASSKSKTAVTENIKAENRGITFIEENWDEALQTARKQNKLVFLDIYASWCGPCKLLKQYTFTDTSVGKFFNNNFVNVSVDGEKGVGPQLAQQFSIEGYPTLVVTDANGKPVLLTAGYMPATDLLRFANEALKRSGAQVKM